MSGVGIAKHAFANVYTLPEFYVKSRASDTAKPMINFYAILFASLVTLQVFAWIARLSGAAFFGTPAWLIFDNPIEILARAGQYIGWSATAGVRALLAPLSAFALMMWVLMRTKRAMKTTIEKSLGYGMANPYDIKGSGYVLYRFDDLKKYIESPGPPCGEITDSDGKVWYIWGKEDEHRLIIAPTGSGKTTRYVFPRILTLDHSFIMLDVKGEGWSNLAGDLTARGFQCVRISLSDDHPENGGINLFQLLPRGIYETRYAQDLAEGVTGGDATNTKASIAEGYFANNAASLITAMTLYTRYMCEPQNQSFRYINHLLTPGKGMTYKKMLERYATTPHDPHFKYGLRDAGGRLTQIHPDIYTPLMQIASAPEQTLQSIVTTAQRYLRPFANPIVARALERTTVDIDKMFTQKIAIFIVVAFSSVKSLGGVNRTWCNFLFKYLCGDRSRKPEEGTVEFIVDEADSMGHAPFLNDDLQVSRGARVFLTLIFQGRNQYLKTFGERQMIEAGCNTQYVLTPNDEDTAKWVDRRLGGMTWTYIRGYDKDGEPNVVTEGRRVLYPDEVYRIPSTHALIFRRGESPMYVRMRGFFDDAQLHERTQITPPFDVSDNERKRLADRDAVDSAAKYFIATMERHLRSAEHIESDLLAGMEQPS